MKYLKYLLLVLPITCVVLFFWYLSWKDGINYGADFFDTIYLFSVCAIIAAYQFLKRKGVYFSVAFVVNILAAAFFLAADRFNIMLNYEKWIHRGMPGAFEKSKIRKFGTSPEEDKLDKELSLWMRKALDGEITQEEFNRESERIREKRKKIE